MEWKKRELGFKDRIHQGAVGFSIRLGFLLTAIHNIPFRFVDDLSAGKEACQRIFPSRFLRVHLPDRLIDGLYIQTYIEQTYGNSLSLAGYWKAVRYLLANHTYIVFQLQDFNGHERFEIKHVIATRPGGLGH